MLLSAHQSSIFCFGLYYLQEISEWLSKSDEKNILIETNSPFLCRKWQLVTYDHWTYRENLSNDRLLKQWLLFKLLAEWYFSHELLKIEGGEAMSNDPCWNKWLSGTLSHDHFKTVEGKRQCRMITVKINGWVILCQMITLKPRRGSDSAAWSPFKLLTNDQVSHDHFKTKTV